MYINNNYANNMSALFQSLYPTNNSNSSSMASLTNTVLGSSSSTNGFYSSLSDYSLIKSGSYGKLMKAYFADEDLNKENKVVTSNDIYEKLKETNAPKTTETEETVSETEDGKVIKKSESTSSNSESSDSAKDDYDALVNLLNENNTVSYTNSGNSIKASIVSSFNFAI